MNLSKSQVCEIVRLLQLSDLLSDPMLFNDTKAVASNRQTEACLSLFSFFFCCCCFYSS